MTTADRARSLAELRRQLRGACAGSACIGMHVSIRLDRDPVADLYVGEEAFSSDVILRPAWCATKPVTAVAALGLAERSDVDLYDDLSGMVAPSLVKLRGDDTLCLARLLSHDLGLVEPRLGEFELASDSRRKLLIRAARPTNGYAYSELLAGLILEDLGGRLYPGGLAAYAKDHVLEPLGVHAACALDGQTALELRDLIAPLHQFVNGRHLAMADRLRPMSLRMAQPATGGYASASSLSIFGDAVSDLAAGRDPQISRSGLPSAIYFQRALSGRRGKHHDVVLGTRVNFAAGFQLDPVGCDRTMPSLGQLGMLGSSWFAVGRRASVACVMGSIFEDQETALKVRRRTIDAVGWFLAELGETELLSVA